MRMFVVVALVAVAGCASTSRPVAQQETEAAAARLSDHLTIIRLVDANDARAAKRFLTTMADSDVMKLMEAYGTDVSGIPDFTRKALISYSRFRQANPDLYGVPSYVDAEGRSEYEQNLKRIQQFLNKIENGVPRQK